MNAVEGAALEHQDLPASLDHFLGRRAEDRDREVDLVEDGANSYSGCD